MITCPKCGKTMDVEYWGSDDPITCDKCGFEWDLQDEDAEKARLFEKLKTKFNIDEENIAFNVMEILRAVDRLAEKVKILDGVKDAAINFVQSAYEHVGGITPENERRAFDTLFSVYYEKNHGEATIYQK